MSAVHRQLNASQQQILVLLYKFRFATRQLIVDYQNLRSSSYTHHRLENLRQQQYIGRYYNNRTKLLGQPVIYYLLPKGRQALQQRTNFSQAGLNLTYKNSSASEQFREHCLIIFKIYLKFRQLYAKELSFYSKTELAAYSHLPRPLPDAYLSFKADGDASRNCLLELISSAMPPYVLRRRIRRYINHYLSGEWQAAMQTDYPLILLVCQNKKLEQKLAQQVKRLMREAAIEELNWRVTSTEDLLGPGINIIS